MAAALSPAYTVGLVEATLRLLLLLLPPHAVLQGVAVNAKDDFKTRDSSISVLKFHIFLQNFVAFLRIHELYC